MAYVAKAMLEKHVDISMIAELTGMSADEIQKLEEEQD